MKANTKKVNQFFKDKNQELSHTPTPWEVGFNKADRTYHIVDCIGGSTMAFSADEENAAFIVRAVNAHEELLHALKCLVAQYDEANEESFAEAYGNALEIIAKAEGR